MKFLLALIFLLCCLSLSEAHQPKKLPRSKLKAIKKELNELDVKIAKLLEDTNRILECLKTSHSDPNWSNVCVKPENGTSRNLERTDVTSTQAGETLLTVFRYD